MIFDLDIVWAEKIFKNKKKRKLNYSYSHRTKQISDVIISNEQQYPQVDKCKMFKILYFK